MWVHPINIKRPEFGIFSHLCLDLLEDGENPTGTRADLIGLDSVGVNTP